MLQATDPLGNIIHVPETLDEDSSYFSIEQLVAACAYYRDQGYVVIRGLVAPELCDRVMAAFDRQARNSKVPILRQKNMRYERNMFDSDGLLVNPIFNIQDLQSSHFGIFKQAVLDMYTDSGVTRVAASVLGCVGAGERVRLIESMFFEAPAGTWPHQDSYYQDSADSLGGATAAWFALEDIGARAGRFYVCPRSHREASPILNHGKNNFGTGHNHYREAVLALARQHQFEWRAPYLAKGDVLFWNSLTIHGSLSQAAGSHESRRSLTGHYLRRTDELLQFHTRLRHQKKSHHRGVEIGLLHDQDELRNRVARTMAFHFPGLWATARSVAIKALVHSRGGEDLPAGVTERRIANPVSRASE
ncbi:MAG: phytanoyl-CoA dioxygenase family protein [Burkholderiaceae bacterium]